MSNADLVERFLLQLVFIIAVCQLVTYVGKRFFSQTQVVCEMIAGIVMGPSLFGYIAPNIQQWLFPTNSYVLNNGVHFSNISMSILYSFGQIGLIFYMFIVGMEFDFNLIKGKANKVAVIVCVAIIAPFTLGWIITNFLYGEFDLFGVNVSSNLAAMYVGIAMSITAFPMLARMLYEYNLTKTDIGILSLASGSICDTASWCLLAVLLTLIKNDKTIAVVAIVGGTFYLYAMLFILKYFFGNFITYAKTNFSFNTVFVFVFVYFMLSAWLTDCIGIYPIFGAFMAGIIMPKDTISTTIAKTLEPLTVKILLPLFFVYSGLNTQLILLNSSPLWLVVAAVIIVAIAGKLIACSVGIRCCGETWSNAITIGTLMNSRGLMELIVLNIGLDYKIITPTMFSVMIVMTILTTFMTAPLFNFMLHRKKNQNDYTATAVNVY